MKLLSIQTPGRARLAMAVGGRVVAADDVWQAAGLEPIGALADVGDLLAAAADPTVMSRLAAAAADIEGLDGAFRYLPPVNRPSKIVGVANNNSLLADLTIKYSDGPAFFLKAPSCLIGHGEPIVIRPGYGLTHPEAELAVIIGRRCRRLTPEEALGAVFGYTIINDITSVTLKCGDTIVYPDLKIVPPPEGFEHGDMQLTYHGRSKSTDTFGPIGPYVVTADQIDDPHDLSVVVRMAGQERQRDHTKGLKFFLPEVLAHLSRYMTLEPGDIVHLGTAARGALPRELDFQHVEGPCEIEIDQIGTLSNPVEHRGDDE